VLILFSCLLAAGWLVLARLTWLAARQMRPLSEEMGEAAAGAPSGTLPALTVVIAARDEAQGIETTVRRLLAQNLPRLEIVAVDDRSSDGTGEILDRLAAGAEAGGLKVIHVRELPGGWLGKCHACQVGAAAGRGEWILFTDGDVSLAAHDLLARVLRLALDRRLDHVAVAPDTRPMTLVQGALMTLFGQMFLLATRAWEMDRDQPRGGAGVGAFNLVRRAAYERVGGHRLLRLDPADDVKLGKLLRETGARQRLFNGFGLVFCRWHTSALQVVRGLEKNFFAGFGYSLTALALATSLLLTIQFGPLAAGLWGLAATDTGAPAALRIVAWVPLALQTALLAAGYAVAVRRSGIHPASALAHPLAVLLLVAAAWNSALRTLSRGGILWRDTFYPLAELRRGLSRPGEGRRFSTTGGLGYDPPGSAPDPS
jgi:cellulose synthase/poly-beta-1,6-N-acetylglucosamine synthase-like glycosyltransferase